MENILYRKESDFRTTKNILVLTYCMKDTFSKFEEEHSKELRPQLNIKNSSIAVLTQFYDHLKSIGMKIASFENDFEEYS